MTDCKYCDIVKNKANILYEDDVLVAVVPSKPCTKGHIQIISKKHTGNMQDIDGTELQHMFYSSSFSASALFENLQAHGTNIIANTGGPIKKDGHFHLDVVARMNDDKLNFLWTPSKVPEEEMKSVQGKIKDKCDMIGVKRKDEEVVDLDKTPEKLESSEEPPSEAESGNKEKNGKEEKKEAEKKDGSSDKESYLIKQLRRLP